MLEEYPRVRSDSAELWANVPYGLYHTMMTSLRSPLRVEKAEPVAGGSGAINAADSRWRSTRPTALRDFRHPPVKLPQVRPAGGGETLKRS